MTRMRRHSLVYSRVFASENDGSRRREGQSALFYQQRRFAVFLYTKKRTHQHINVDTYLNSIEITDRSSKINCCDNPTNVIIRSNNK